MASGWVHIPRAPSFSMAKQFSVSDVSKQINLNTLSFLLWLTSYKVCFGYATYHFFSLAWDNSCRCAIDNASRPFPIDKFFLLF